VGDIVPVMDCIVEEVDVDNCAMDFLHFGEPFSLHLVSLMCFLGEEQIAGDSNILRMGWMTSMEIIHRVYHLPFTNLFSFHFIFSL